MSISGIEKLSFYVPGQYLELATLAEQHKIDPAKYSRGLGQEKIAMPCHDEDIVTMAAEAALPIIEDVGVEDIDTVLFATESGIDQSKAAGIYVHKLLGLSENCRVVELKQACYSATASVLLACSHVAMKPGKKVLVLASDVSRYDLNSPAEATQGAGAVAVLISTNPSILKIDPASGCFTEDIMDFWRPNYRKTPLVDGKYSTVKYLNALGKAWEHYQSEGGREFSAFSHMCYHIPFSRMGEKAHKQLSSINQVSCNRDLCTAGLIYNRQIGNCYAASLYISIISALEHMEDATNKVFGLFSYGSGAVAEFFSGQVQAGYKDHLYSDRHAQVLTERSALSYEAYLHLWHAPDPQDGGTCILPNTNRGNFRLASFNEHKRIYESSLK